MSEAREEDEIEQVPIPLTNVSPAISKNESELKELIEDLTRMGCEGLLAKPWNLLNEAALRDFYSRGETNGLEPFGKIRRGGRPKCGLRFTSSLQERAKDGLAARIVCM